MTLSEDILFILVIVAGTSVVQSISGFGFALLSVPLFALRLEVHDAVVLSACVGTISSGWQTLLLREHANREITRRFVSSSLVGIPLGFLIFVTTSDRVLRVAVGIAVLGGTSIVALMPKIRFTSFWERLLGVVSGALLIATSTNGPPIVLALQAQRMPMQEFRGTLARIFFVTGVVSVVLFAVDARIDSNMAIGALSCLPVMTAGVLIGNRVVRFIREDFFRVVVLALLFGAGVSSVAAAFS